MRLLPPIYFDYMATTPVDEQVAASMHDYLTWRGVFANPASDHALAAPAQHAVETARAAVATAIGARSTTEIVWTSGATEANNLALQGVAQAYAGRGKHIVTCATEHKAVLACCAYLERQGFSITYLRPQADGLLDLAVLQAALRSDTVLVSVMHVNNETGVIQDIARIAALVHAQDALLHVDAAQSVGKIAVDVQQWDADLVSLCAHKSYGPKGIGALYVRKQPRVRLQALLYGGGQEHGLRPGTLPVHQIVGMGAAFALAQQRLVDEVPHIAALRDQLWQGLQRIPAVSLNGSLVQRVAHNVHVSVAGVDGQALRVALCDLAVANGSACNAASTEPSHVLLAMGVDPVLAHASLRFSLGRFTTSQDITYAIRRVADEVQRLRALSPCWEHKHDMA